MKKVIKILVVIVIVVAGGVVWVKNPGDIQSKILRSKAQAEKKAKQLMKSTQLTPEDIERGKQCRQMLDRIQRAKRAAEEKKGISGATVTWEEVLPILNMKDMPKCPSGGVYKLNPPLVVPSCSIGNNRTIETADDHIIYY